MAHWIVAEIVQALLIKGARTGLVLFLVAAFLFYYRMIKPLSIKDLVPLGAPILVGFLYMGVYRSYLDVTDMQSDLRNSNANILSTTNE